MSYRDFPAEKASLLADGTEVLLFADPDLPSPPPSHPPLSTPHLLSFTIYPTTDADLADNDFLWYAVRDSLIHQNAARALLRRRLPPHLAEHATLFSLLLPSSLASFLRAVSLEEMRHSVVDMLADFAQAEDYDVLVNMSNTLAPSIWSALVDFFTRPSTSSSTVALPVPFSSSSASSPLPSPLTSSSSSSSLSASSIPSPSNLSPPPSPHAHPLHPPSPSSNMTFATVMLDAALQKAGDAHDYWKIQLTAALHVPHALHAPLHRALLSTPSAQPSPPCISSISSSSSYSSSITSPLSSSFSSSSLSSSLPTSSVSSPSSSSDIDIDDHPISDAFRTCRNTMTAPAASQHRARLLQSLFLDWRTYHASSLLCDVSTADATALDVNSSRHDMEEDWIEECPSEQVWYENDHLCSLRAAARRRLALDTMITQVGAQCQEDTWERVRRVRECASKSNSLLATLPTQIVDHLLVPRLVFDTYSTPLPPLTDTAIDSSLLHSRDSTLPL